MSSQASDFVLSRLSNFKNAAEGPQLAPPMRANQRVPNVSSPSVLLTSAVTGGTKFTLGFLEPARGNYSYRVFYQVTNQGAGMSGPIVGSGAPIVVFVPSAANETVTFFIQSALSSGLSSDIQSSPTCTGKTI